MNTIPQIRLWVPESTTPSSIDQFWVSFAPLVNSYQRNLTLIGQVESLLLMTYFWDRRAYRKRVRSMIRRPSGFQSVKYTRRGALRKALNNPDLIKILCLAIESEYRLGRTFWSVLRFPDEVACLTEAVTDMMRANYDPVTWAYRDPSKIHDWLLQYAVCISDEVFLGQEIEEAA